MSHINEFSFVSIDNDDNYDNDDNISEISYIDNDNIEYDNCNTDSDDEDTMEDILCDW